MRYSVVLGNGDGTFKSAVQYQAGLGVRGVTLADMNSDGNLDMVMVNHTEGSIAVSFGDGTGSFSGYTDYHGLTTKSAYNISLGDVDGDGHLDVLVSQNDDKLALFRGSASGALGPMELIAAPSAVREAHLVDVNGDGHLDIVAGFYSTGSAGVSFGKGDGTFGTFSQVGSGFGQVQEMIVQDLDGDGLVDVAITTLDDKTVDLLKGNGDGTFQSPTTIDIGLDGARRIAAGDLNGDGALDIVVGIDGPGAADPMAVFIANTREYSLMPRLDLTTKESARSTLDFLDLISELVSSERGQIGAALSRFEYAGNVLEAMNSNSHTAASRIVDADIAFESAAAVRERILQQSATAVLSQANQAPALALRLLDI